MSRKIATLAIDMGMKRTVPARQRRDEIVKLVTQGHASVKGLSEQFEVSLSTIRRDLQGLADQGRIARTFGGAIQNPGSLELTLQEKELDFPREKDAIARHAAELIQPGETVFLDAGTTAGRLAWHLRERDDLCVITNGVNTVATLAMSEGIELIVLGGTLRHATQALLGNATAEMISHFTADKAFIGCDGIVAGQGLSTATQAQAYIKRAMLRQATERFVLADHSKLGVRRFHHITPLVSEFGLLTDSGASDEQLAPFESLKDAAVTVVDPEGSG